jgi:uncharacterized protein (TIGR00369 family)
MRIEESAMAMKIGDYLRGYVDGTLPEDARTTMQYPPPISRTLGFDVVELGAASAVMQMTTDPAEHANPMGTIHGGVLCDIADAAIGTAHVTTLEEGESFTSVDLRINFFRPVWKDTLRASASATHLGKTISYYTCDITRGDGKLVATVTSTVMTLRGAASAGR